MLYNKSDIVCRATTEMYAISIFYSFNFANNGSRVEIAFSESLFGFPWNGKCWTKIESVAGFMFQMGLIFICENKRIFLKQKESRKILFNEFAEIVVGYLVKKLW